MVKNCQFFNFFFFFYKKYAKNGRKSRNINRNWVIVPVFSIFFFFLPEILSKNAPNRRKLPKFLIHFIFQFFFALPVFVWDIREIWRFWREHSKIQIFELKLSISWPNFEKLWHFSNKLKQKQLFWTHLNSFRPNMNNFWPETAFEPDSHWNIICLRFDFYCFSDLIWTAFMNNFWPEFAFWSRVHTFYSSWTATAFQRLETSLNNFD